MKRVLIILIIILIIISSFLFLKQEDKKDLNNYPLINSSKNCNYMYYLGAGAIGHKFGIDCHSVYHTAFDSNESYHCEYLSLDKNKAICFGSSIISWENKSVCNKFNGDNKEICILNVLNKLNKLNLLDTVKSSSICSDFKNQTLYRICNNYQNVILKDYSSCLSKNENKDYCIYGFITINKNEDLSKSLCENAFNDTIKRFKCFFESKAIKSSWLNESLNLGIIKENNIEKNASFLFSEIYIKTDYPILLRFNKNYWKKNINYVKNSTSSSEFILDTDLKDYICTKKITSISDINQSCIPYDWSYLFDFNSFPNIHWNYYKSY